MACLGSPDGTQLCNPSPLGRLIGLATCPASKPLSIFTTVTLLARLFTRLGSAARPWKPAPLFGFCMLAQKLAPALTASRG